MCITITGPSGDTSWVNLTGVGRRSAEYFCLTDNVTPGIGNFRQDGRTQDGPIAELSQPDNSHLHDLCNWSSAMTLSDNLLQVKWEHTDVFEN